MSRSHPARLILLLLALLMLAPSFADAQETRRYQTNLQRHNQLILSLEQKDPEGLIKAQLNQIREHIQKANFHLGQEDYDIVDQKLRRIDAELALADAQLGFQKAKAIADQKTTAAEEMRARHTELTVQLEGVKGKIKLLQEQKAAKP